MATVTEAGASGLLDALGRDLDAALVSPRRRASCRRVLSAIPLRATEGLGLECHLGRSGAVDVFTSLANGHAGHAVVAGTRRSHLMEALVTDPAWARIRRFHGDWDRPDAPWRGRIQNVIWEFDVEGASSPPVPSVFLSLKERVRGARAEWRPWLTGGGGPAADALAILAAIHGALVSSPLDATTREVLVHFLEELPREAGVFHVGLMIARPMAPLRLCLRGAVAPEAWPTRLADAGWEGPVERAVTVAGAAAAAGCEVRPLVDVAGGIGERLGLELVPAEGEPGLAALLDTAEAAGWLTAPQTAALRAWPGQRVTELGGVLYPVVLHRWFSHLKVVVGGRGPGRTKAYLAATIRSPGAGPAP